MTTIGFMRRPPLWPRCPDRLTYFEQEQTKITERGEEIANCMVSGSKWRNSEKGSHPLLGGTPGMAGVLRRYDPVRPGTKGGTKRYEPVICRYEAVRFPNTADSDMARRKPNSCEQGAASCRTRGS